MHVFKATKNSEQHRNKFQLEHEFAIFFFVAGCLIRVTYCTTYNNTSTITIFPIFKHLFSIIQFSNIHFSIDHIFNFQFSFIQKFNFQFSFFQIINFQNSYIQIINFQISDDQLFKNCIFILF